MHRQRIYLLSSSYPELRFIPRGLTLYAVWWRALGSAFHSVDLWRFVATNFVIALSITGTIYFLADRFIEEGFWRYACQIFGLFCGIVFYGGRSITTGGNIIRPHFRRTTAACRTTCPNCGYDLQSQLGPVLKAIRPGGTAFPLYRAMLNTNTDFNVPPIRCRECGVTTDVAAFVEPFQINCNKKPNRQPRSSA